MRTIYGLKMLTLDDIIMNTGGKPNMCTYLRKNENILDKFNDEEKYIIDVGMNGNFPIYNILTPYKFIFVSMDLLEERMILDSVIPSLRNISEILMNVTRVEKVSRIINRYESAYDEYASKYSGESLLTQPCFMFVYGEKYNLIDVYTAIPQDVLSFLSNPIIYKCCNCNKEVKSIPESFEAFLPDIYYSVNKQNEITYMCKECMIKNVDPKQFKKVGE